MACCTGRCFLIFLCTLQLITSVERQVFEFLGYMLAPIIGNFLHIIFVIIGLFGACQYRHRILIVYAIWCLIWIGWNAFIICFYLEVGMLNRDMRILSIGTGSQSWWNGNRILCYISEVTNNSSYSTDSSIQPVVSNCLIQYYYIEVIHAGIQCILAVISFSVSCFVIYVFTEEEDASQPVHDELEYIKMRYRSPARQSFRGNKAYENLTIRSDATATLEGRVYRQQSSDVHPPSKIRSTSGSTIGKSDKIPIFTDCIDSQNDSPWLEGTPTMQLNVPAVDADETQTRIPPDV